MVILYKSDGARLSLILLERVQVVRGQPKKDKRSILSQRAGKLVEGLQLSPEEGGCTSQKRRRTSQLQVKRAPMAEDTGHWVHYLDIIRDKIKNTC